MGIEVLTASQSVHTLLAPHTEALLAALQTVFPFVPGQQGVAEVKVVGFEMHVDPQHMSFVGFSVHAPGVPPLAPGPVHALDTHLPAFASVVVSHTCPVPHWESRVHLPH
jgi:hypothetical protein